MANPADVAIVQELYPLLYFAIHRSHGRADELSEKDLRLLHHCAGPAGTWASRLADHLGLSRSTVSQTIGKLEEMGLIVRDQADGSRVRAIRLTQLGRDAIEAGEGLNARAIGAILDRLDAEEVDRVIEGLRMLKAGMERGE